jgi:hypothetical protein
VGLVAGACFAESGNDVVCVDKNEAKVRTLKAGRMPIYEPGLEEIVRRNRTEGRLTFTTNLPKAVRESAIVFIAVGTPEGEDGSADLSHVLQVARDIARAMNGYKVIVDKSTVPVGTSEKVREAVRVETTHPFSIVSNPEFLKQGAAIEDFTPALHLHQRAILVLPHLRLLGLQTLQPTAYFRFNPNLYSQRQRVDEQPHHLFHSSQLRRPARHRHAIDHILLAAVATQQHGPCSLHHRVQRHLLLSRQCFQHSCRLFVQLQVLLAVALRVITAALCVYSQMYRRPEPCQSVSPVAFSRLKILSL